MKKPNLQRLAQGSKIYLRKASPTILSGLGAAGVIVTSVLAVRATPKALRKIRADSKANHKGDPDNSHEQRHPYLLQRDIAINVLISESTTPKLMYEKIDTIWCLHILISLPNIHAAFLRYMKLGIHNQLHKCFILRLRFLLFIFKLYKFA